MAVNNSDYFLQQLVNQSKDTNDGLTAIRELLAESLKEEKKSSKPKNNNGTPSTTPNNRQNRQNNKSPFGNMFKIMGNEISSVSKTLMNSSTNVGTVVNSLGMSASSVAGAFTMLPGPVGAAATAFKMVADVSMAVYNALNAQLEMYNQVNSAGVTLERGYSTLLKGSGSALMSVDKFSEALVTHSAVVAQLDGVYGDGAQQFGKLLGSVQNAQNQLGLYGISQKTLTDMTARNVKFQKQYGGAEMLRNMDQARSTENFILNMSKFSKSIGESIDSLLNKTQSLDKSLDTRSMQIALKSFSGLSEETATLTSKAFNEVAATMGDSGADFLRLISHRLTIGGVPDDLMSPVMVEFADLNERLVRSGEKDSKVIRAKQLEYIKAQKSRIEQDILDQKAIGNISAAILDQQMLDMLAAANEENGKPADKLSQFTDRFNRWISTEFTQPFNNLYADIQNSTVDYLSNLADTTDGAWDFIGTLVLDGFGVLPKIIDSGFSYLFGTLSTWADNLGTTIFGDGYTRVSNAFNTFIDNLVDLPGQLWKSVKSWWGDDEENAKPKEKEDSRSWWEKITANTDPDDSLWDTLKKKYDSWDFGDSPDVDLPDSLINNNIPPEQRYKVETREVPDMPSMMNFELKPKPAEIPFNGHINSPREDTTTPQQNDLLENIVEEMQRNRNNTDQTNTLINQMNQYLRTISENTQGERNS